MSRYITEQVEDELLVYDRETFEVHCLDESVADQWSAIRTDRRRAFLLGSLAGIVTIVAPTVAQAASCPTTCERGDFGKQCSKGGGSCNGRCVGRRCL